MIKLLFAQFFRVKIFAQKMKAIPSGVGTFLRVLYNKEKVRLLWLRN